MISWKNLDTLAAYGKLNALKDHVKLQEAMSGESGAKRVAEYTVPMAAGLAYHYAAKQVDDTVLNALAELANDTVTIGKKRSFAVPRNRLRIIDGVVGHILINPSVFYLAR